VGVIKIEADAQNEPECDDVTLADVDAHTVFVSVGDTEKDDDTVPVTDALPRADCVYCPDGVEDDDLHSVCVGEIVGECDGLADAVAQNEVVELSEAVVEVVPLMVGEFVKSSTVGVMLLDVVSDAIDDFVPESVADVEVLADLDCVTVSEPVVDMLIECVNDPLTVGLCDSDCDTHLEIVGVPDTDKDVEPVKLVETVAECDAVSVGVPVTLNDGDAGGDPVRELLVERLRVPVADVDMERETDGDAVALRVVVATAETLGDALTEETIHVEFVRLQK
jgi:hypothetical protein